MADPDFGSDFSAVDDIDANFSLAPTSRTAFIQAMLRRISTPRGALFYAPDYGTDIGAYVNTAKDPRQLEQIIESELLNDERVQDARATVTVVDPEDKSVTGGSGYNIDLSLETDEGPFSLVLSVNAVTGALLLKEVT